VAQKKKTNRAFLPPPNTAELTLRYTTKKGYRYRTYEFNLDKLPLLKKVRGESAPVYERAKKVEVEGKKKTIPVREVKERGGFYDTKNKIWRIEGYGGGGGMIKRGTTITTRGRAVDKGAGRIERAPRPSGRRVITKSSLRLYSSSVYVIPLDETISLEEAVYSDYFNFRLHESEAYGAAMGNLKGKILPTLGTIIDPQTGLERPLKYEDIRINDVQMDIQREYES
jgi:hypothetical protein